MQLRIGIPLRIPENPFAPHLPGSTDSHLRTTGGFGSFRFMRLPQPFFNAKRLPLFLGILAATALSLPGHAGDLKVTTEFPGGSARVESIDQTTRTIRFM